MTLRTKAEQIETAIDQFYSIREQCYKAMLENPAEILGDDFWLRNAIQESDLNLSLEGATILCWGRAFTSQTQSREDFEFRIPIEQIEV